MAFVASVAVGYVFGGQGQVVEAGFCCDLHAAVAGFSQEGDGLDGGEVDDVQWEIWSQVCEGEDLFNGVGFECRRAGGQEGRVGRQRPGGGQRGERLLYVVSDRVGGRGNHLGVEHEGCGGVGEGRHG